MRQEFDNSAHFGFETAQLFIDETTRQRVALPQWIPNSAFPASRIQHQASIFI